MKDRKEKYGNNPEKIVRRDFIKASGTVYIAAVVGCTKPQTQARKLTLGAGEVVSDYPPSQGYLVVDAKKCQGCLSCMLACSLAHHGQENLSLSRIQIVQDPFEKFPDDISIEQCRQCVDPQCVKECPEGALTIDKQHGNVRKVDKEKCVGCMTCVNSCPHLPSRAIWNKEEQIAQKCDLCAEIPYWNEQGGPFGKQACVEVCPVAAIKFQSEIPIQEGDAGYKVNLRGEAWEKLGYPID